ncbi:MAG: hypothetical protein H6581_12905 [Bacteroidia bacterium]|nr:hypothetical protein [Bacteroidia bacterium]
MILGIHYEDDSFGYLQLQAGLYHPPGYNLFASLAARFLGLYGIVVLQSGLFALVSALALLEWVQNSLFRGLAALLLAADYASGIFCVSILSESVFLSETILTLILLVRLGNNPAQLKTAALLGLLLGASYLTRYAATLTLLVAIFYLVLLHWRRWRQILFPIFLLIAGFQLAILPLKAYYAHEFGTWKINAFSGMNQWNNAAYLYPEDSYCGISESEIFDSQSLKSRFIVHLLDQNQEYGIFNLRSTFTTAHIHDPNYPLQSFIRQENLSTQEIMQLSGELSCISRHLILKYPVEHLTRFILPNLLHPFQESEKVAFPETDLWFQENFHYTNPHPFNWNRYYWILAFFLLLVSLGLAINQRKRLGRATFALMLYILAYLPAVTISAAMFQRYVWFLIPLILIFGVSSHDKR